MKTSQKETRRCVTMMRNNLFVVFGKMKIATEGVEVGGSSGVDSHNPHGDMQI